MPSVFISYSHNPTCPTHEEQVAGLAAAFLRDGLRVFLDANRGKDEEKLTWPIWMEGKIEEADHVLLVCTELYLKKIRQEVAEDEGQGVCWEANIIYSLLYERKLNTTKFSPVLFSPADKCFIPAILRGRDCFIVNSQSGYDRLYAFITDQYRMHFPKQGATLKTVAQKTVQPSFAPPGETATPALTDYVPAPGYPIPAISLQLTLKPTTPPVPRHDIRGLDWYDECDAGHFIGRSDDVNQILGKLMPHPILRLVGPSGVGKSSLVRAGLLPKIRESGWRACVIRPFEDPAKRVPAQLTAELLAGPGAFTTPLAPAKFRAEVSPLLSSNGVNSLVLFFDQFEDIVSPVAAQSAVDTMREFLRELWEQKEVKPYLRAAVVYSTDADLRLGRLWQEVSGRSEGLPYLALEGLSRGVTERIISQTAREQRWRLDSSVPEITRQLALETQKLDCSGEVFPVYLQILLKQAEQNNERRITADFLTNLGSVSDLIGEYLERTLARLMTRGGDWQRCGTVLESLSRSSGAKAARSFNDLVGETGLSRTLLAEMLPVLINERLVRPIGHERYEIQHDRLGAAVIESMKTSDREAKMAREFLVAKVPAFERTMVALTPSELVYLYRHRQKIHPTEPELRSLWASILHNVEAGARNESPGAYWFGQSSQQDFLRWFIQIEHWSAKERSSLRPSHAWTRTFPLRDLESQFADLAADSIPFIRVTCAQWIGRTKRDEYLPLLRELAKDADLNVRTAAIEVLSSFSRIEDLLELHKLAKDQVVDVRIAAMKGLASFSGPEVLPMLRELAKDQHPDVRALALGTLASFSGLEVLPVLRELLGKDQNLDVRTAVIKALASVSRPESLPLLRNLAKDQDPEVRTAVIKALANFSRPEDLDLLRELAKDWRVRAEALKALTSISVPEALPRLSEMVLDVDLDVRTAAIKALASFSGSEVLPVWREIAQDRGSYYRSVRDLALEALGSFSEAEALPLLREMTEDRDFGVRSAATKALASFARPEDLPIIRKLAKGRRVHRKVAVEALASFSMSEDLPYLREIIKDRESDVRTAVIKALGRFSGPEVPPLLRKLAKDEDPDARTAAVEALASFAQPKDLPLLREIVKDQDRYVRRAAIKVLASFAQAEDLAMLRGLAKDEDPDVRTAVIKALTNFSRVEDLPLLRALVKDQDWRVRVKVAEALATFLGPEDLPLLRALAKDEDPDVRTAAIKSLAGFAQAEALSVLRELAKDPYLGARTLEALASFSGPEDLRLLRALAKDENSDLRTAAIKALTSFSGPEVLKVLRELALEPDGNVAGSAIKVLATRCSREELEALLIQHDRELCPGALAALDELLYMPEWMKAKVG
jgi:HEAT repeat protein